MWLGNQEIATNANEEDKVLRDTQSLDKQFREQSLHHSSLQGW